MSALLGDLERNGFRAADGEERKIAILRRSLAQVGEFYRDFPMPPDATWLTSSAAPSAWLPEAHRSELRELFGGADALHSIAAAIVIYPTPHWPAPHGALGEYQIDVILNDEVAPVAFAEAVRAIKHKFGGRTFGVGGTHAQFTMVPRAAFEHPWYFLGTPFPFLHEHVAAFAETLFGAPPLIPAAPAHAERLRWCAQYYLFHRFTLRYRPRRISKDCNFCQLAALRLFLAHGDVLTDAKKVARAFADAAVKRGDDSPALDFMVRDQGELADQASFAAALRLQSREYDAVEALLRARSALA
jgi:hypothetical protein